MATMATNPLNPGSLLPWIERRFVSATGAPLANGTVSTYAAGTTTPLETYADADLTVANQVVIALDAQGAPPRPMYLKPQAYKFVVKDVHGDVQTHYPQDVVYDNGQRFATYFGYALAAGPRDVNTNIQIAIADHLVTMKPVGAAALPVYLPPAVYALWPVTIKNIGNAGGSVTINPNGADQIESGPTLTLPAGGPGSFPSVTLLSNGSNMWYVVASHKMP